MNFPKPVVYASLFATGMGAIVLTKDYMGGKSYKGTEKLKDKVVIVTGANTGIGKELAHALAQREAKVIMACRDMDKCEYTRENIVYDTQNKYVYCRYCDLASQDSIRKFAKMFKKEFHSKLDILINNGAVMRCPKSFTKEGIEMQLGVNHMGHFLLTNLLLDCLKQSAPSRIVNVTSSAHKRGKIKVDDLNSSENYDPGEAYNQSKLANVIFTRELAKHLKGTGVTVNAVHPGMVDTEITRHMWFQKNILRRILLKPFMWIGMKSPKQGAQPILYAALDPSLNDVSGEYFDNFEVANASDDAQNEKLGKWLWAVSEKWTKLNA